MTNICIFCGANYSGDPLLGQAVEQLAEIMVTRDITLVYGGGKAGVMGMIADAVLGKGGKAIGVLPRFLMAKEIEHLDLRNCT